MCDICDRRKSDARYSAFQEMGLLEVLTKADMDKVDADEQVFISLSLVTDGPAADVRAAAMSITNAEIRRAIVRPLTVCLN